MTDKEIIPCHFERKLSYLLSRHLKQSPHDKLLNELLDWAQDLLTKEREHWKEQNAFIFDTVMHLERKEAARRRGKCRDKLYAPFREYYKSVQKQKFDNSLQNGTKFSAASFAL